MKTSTARLTAAAWLVACGLLAWSAAAVAWVACEAPAWAACRRAACPDCPVCPSDCRCGRCDDNCPCRGVGRPCGGPGCTCVAAGRESP